MLRRCETPALRTFVRSVLQGESLGVSTGQIMRNLALEMRKRRRAKAEERAQKAPVKMLFPLIFLIFPAMFVVLLGPAIYAISKVFDSAGGRHSMPRQPERSSSAARTTAACSASAASSPTRSGGGFAG